MERTVRMRDYKAELENRVAFIKGVLRESGARGIVFGNSGGKDSALVGILCRKACDNVLGVILPCSSRRNYGEDMKEAVKLAEMFDIQSITVDLHETRQAVLKALGGYVSDNGAAAVNISPRLRMTALYAIAQSRGSLVAGTGNRSEAYVGYFTKWGDGAYDFNPISDLTVTEIYEFLRYLNAPASIIEKPPSAALFEGQTDEGEMGFSYEQLDGYLLNGTAPADVLEKINYMHNRSEHKRRGVLKYKED
jgi:NAD+ synthase